MRTLERKRRSVEQASIVRSTVTLNLLGLASAAIVVANANAQVLSVHPGVETRLTFTDNARASDSKKSDWIAEVSPTIAVSRDKGRIIGRMNARLRNIAHFSDSDRDTTFLALQGNAQIEAVEDTLFIDMDGSISRNNRSSLTGRAAEDFLGTESANETRQFGVGPRLHFRLGGETQARLSYKLNWFDGGRAALQRTIGNTVAHLGNPRAFGPAGWALDYTRSDTSYDDAANNEVSQETARASLYYALTPQLRVRGIVGREANDYSTGRRESGRITGGGFEWYPTPRTSLAGDLEDRIFGRGYHLNFKHHRARSVWDLSYARDISSSLQPNGDVFDDPAFRSLYDALAFAIPDPFEREIFVRQQLGYPAPGLRDAFVTNNHFVARSLRGSVSLIGVRDTLTFSMQRSERSRLGSPLVTDSSDDLATFSTVKTQSATISLNHRMTPSMTMNASLGRSRSTGAGAGSGANGDAETRRTLLSAGLSNRFSRYTTGALTYRHQQAEGRANFTENILTATFSVQF
jgi:uncharacterized protein (PEP-CTERM system associated)